MTPRSAEERRQQALVRRPCQLLDLISQEQNRLPRSPDSITQEMIKSTLEHLKTQLKLMDQHLESLLAERAQQDPKVKILAAYPASAP